MVKVRLVVIEFSFECSRWLKAGLTLLAVNDGCMAGIKHKVDAAFDIGTKGDSLFQPLQKQALYPPAGCCLFRLKSYRLCGVDYRCGLVGNVRRIAERKKAADELPF
jgi:hypothetical protein